MTREVSPTGETGTGAEGCDQQWAFGPGHHPTQMTGAGVCSRCEAAHAVGGAVNAAERQLVVSDPSRDGLRGLTAADNQAIFVSEG